MASTPLSQSVNQKTHNVSKTARAIAHFYSSGLMSEKLRKRASSKVLEVLTRDTGYLLYKYGMSEKSLKNLQLAYASKHQCLIETNALQLWQQHSSVNQEKTEPFNRTMATNFPTGLHSLDTILLGGLRTGTITELIGGPGCGKTQFCHWMTSRWSFAGKRVIYVDVDGTFSALRITQLLHYLFRGHRRNLRRVLRLRGRLMRKYFQFKFFRNVTKGHRKSLRFVKKVPKRVQRSAKRVRQIAVRLEACRIAQCLQRVDVLPWPLKSVLRGKPPMGLSQTLLDDDTNVMNLLLEQLPNLVTLCGNSPVSAIVMDCLAKPFLGSVDFILRSQLLMQLAHVLKELSAKYGIWLLLTNHEMEVPLSKESGGTTTVGALGMSWFHCVTVRLRLSRHHPVDASQQVDFRVVKAPHASSSTVVTTLLNSSGFHDL